MERDVYRDWKVSHLKREIFWLNSTHRLYLEQWACYPCPGAKRLLLRLFTQESCPQRLHVKPTEIHQLTYYFKKNTNDQVAQISIALWSIFQVRNPPKVNQQKLNQALALYHSQRMTVKEIQEAIGASDATLYRFLKEEAPSWLESFKNLNNS